MRVNVDLCLGLHVRSVPAVRNAGAEAWLQAARPSADPRVRAWMGNRRGKIMWCRLAPDSRRHPEVRSTVALRAMARSFLVQASSWPSGLVPASAGKLTCTETSGFFGSQRCIFVP